MNRNNEHENDTRNPISDITENKSSQIKNISVNTFNIVQTASCYSQQSPFGFEFEREKKISPIKRGCVCVLSARTIK